MLVFELVCDFLHKLVGTSVRQIISKMKSVGCSQGQMRSFFHGNKGYVAGIYCQIRPDFELFQEFKPLNILYIFLEKFDSL